jgi:hypothetical protein
MYGRPYPKLYTIETKNREYCGVETGVRTTWVHATPYNASGRVGAGIDIGCNTLLPTVSGNTILGLRIALNNMPSC